MTRSTGLLFAAVLLGGLIQPAQADPVKLGLLIDSSGPLSSFSNSEIAIIELAIKQINDGGGLRGEPVELIRKDTQCQAASAVSAAKEALNNDKVAALIGPYCSGSLLAVAEKVTLPEQHLLLSPAAASPELDKLDSRDSLFRLTPSLASEPKALADYLLAENIHSVAVAFLQQDAMSQMADIFKETYQAKGGLVQAYVGYEGEKSHYDREMSALANQDADTLILFDYGSGSGTTFLRLALDSQNFQRILGSESMMAESVVVSIDEEKLAAFSVVKRLKEETDSTKRFNRQLSRSGQNANQPFLAESYDAVFLLALSLEAQEGEGKASLAKSLRNIASGPGEILLPGDWREALRFLKEGKTIHYQGASGSLDFDDRGMIKPLYGLFEVDKGLYVKRNDL